MADALDGDPAAHRRRAAGNLPMRASREGPCGRRAWSVWRLDRRRYPVRVRRLHRGRAAGGSALGRNTSTMTPEDTVHYVALKTNKTPCGIDWQYGVTIGRWVNHRSMWRLITCQTCRKAIDRYMKEPEKRSVKAPTSGKAASGTKPR